ncbi:hypothetical protein DFH06DRAFT_1227820 [Mycena polygramma]|nr:hypothetical protein DFH06DRAFT_1227820 [Mycena polygramma]
MRPRIARLHERLVALSPAVSAQVGPVAPLSAFRDFQMVVSHLDLALENIICRLEPSISITVIDWEFCAYVPEFYVALELGNKWARGIWGTGLVEDVGYRSYPKLVLWTASLCSVAKDYEGDAFERNVRVALTARD